MYKWGFCFAVCASLVTARADGLPKVFPHLTRIRYDGQCLTIDEQDVFIFSGSFHSFHCPRELWREQFRKIKEAGCNAVETCVPWSWHERNKPSSPADFSQVDFTDLKDWLHMAQDEFGLYTIVRAGPYIGADWDGGGFPRWLLPLQRKVAPDAQWLRSDDPTYLEWAKHWMDAVCPVIAAEQITRKPRGRPGVILMQIENEYDAGEGIPESAKISQLRTLYQAAVAGGIEVPIFTSATRQCRESDDPFLSQVFDTVNLDPRMDIDSSAQKIAQLESDQPDAPAMVSELPAGDQLGITSEQLNAHTLLAIESGATIINCDLAFGDTGFGGRYLALGAIGRMLQEHGAALTRSRPIPCQVETASTDVTVTARLTRDNGIYLFFRNGSLTTRQRGVAVIWLEKSGEIEVNYDLGPLGFNILYMAPGVRWPFDSGHSVPASRTLDGRPQRVPTGVEWLPKPVAGPERPALRARKKNVLTLCLSPMGKDVRLRAMESSPSADQAEFR